MELLPILVVTLIMLTIYKFNSIKQKFTRSYRDKIMAIILIGCCGSLPLMLTLVQKGFYLSHSLPVFAIGFALIIAPGLAALIDRINTDRQSFKIFKIISILQCYLIRHFNISVDPSENYHDYYLIRKTLGLSPGNNYEKIPLTTRVYNLYRSKADSD